MLGTFSPPRVSDPGMHHGTCMRKVPWWMPRSLTSSFLLSRLRGKRSRYSRRMRNSQFHVSGKRPMKLPHRGVALFLWGTIAVHNSIFNGKSLVHFTFSRVNMAILIFLFVFLFVVAIYIIMFCYEMICWLRPMIKVRIISNVAILRPTWKSWFWSYSTPEELCISTRLVLMK